MTTDHELVLAAQAGDTEAFGRLVARHQRAAYGHAVALLGQREAAQDALQDSFLAAFRALRKLAPERPFFPWFYVILRNRCFSMLRSRRTFQSLDESREFVVAEATDDDATCVRAAMSRLSTEDREILVLKYVDGHGYRQIAEWLGIPLGTVASRLHEARRRLAEQLRETHTMEAQS